jgi:hypothetical protein
MFGEEGKEEKEKERWSAGVRGSAPDVTIA